MNATTTGLGESGAIADGSWGAEIYPGLEPDVTGNNDVVVSRHWNSRWVSYCNVTWCEYGCRIVGYYLTVKFLRSVLIREIRYLVVSLTPMSTISYASARSLIWSWQEWLLVPALNPLHDTRVRCKSVLVITGLFGIIKGLTLLTLADTMLLCCKSYSSFNAF